MLSGQILDCVLRNRKFSDPFHQWRGLVSNEEGIVSQKNVHLCLWGVSLLRGAVVTSWHCPRGVLWLQPVQKFCNYSSYLGWQWLMSAFMGPPRVSAPDNFSPFTPVWAALLACNTVAFSESPLQCEMTFRGQHLVFWYPTLQTPFVQIRSFLLCLNIFLDLFNLFCQSQTDVLYSDFCGKNLLMYHWTHQLSPRSVLVATVALMNAPGFLIRQLPALLLNLSPKEQTMLYGHSSLQN